LGIGQFLNAVLVPDDVGWRKPNRRIFEKAISRLKVKPEETVHVRDCPLENTKGAAAVGMRTIFVPSQFYSLQDLRESQQEPDLIVESICDLNRNLQKYMSALAGNHSLYAKHNSIY
jgi:putative hydrolase of the HAD superfamily